jgi:hypothetical protein
MVFALLRRRSEKDRSEVKQEKAPKVNRFLRGSTPKGKEAIEPKVVEAAPKPEDVDVPMPGAENPAIDTIDDAENVRVKRETYSIFGFY